MSLPNGLAAHGAEIASSFTSRWPNSPITRFVVGQPDQCIDWSICDTPAYLLDGWQMAEGDTESGIIRPSTANSAMVMGFSGDELEGLVGARECRRPAVVFAAGNLLVGGGIDLARVRQKGGSGPDQVALRILRERLYAHVGYFDGQRFGRNVFRTIPVNRVDGDGPGVPISDLAQRFPNAFLV